MLNLMLAFYVWDIHQTSTFKTNIKNQFISCKPIVYILLHSPDNSNNSSITHNTKIIIVAIIKTEYVLIIGAVALITMVSEAATE